MSHVQRDRKAGEHRTLDEEEYRRKEEEARRLAEYYQDHDRRDTWLRLAEWWKQLRERAASKLK